MSQQQQYHREKQTREAELADADQQTQVKAAAEKKAEFEKKVAAEKAAAKVESKNNQPQPLASRHSIKAKTLGTGAILSGTGMTTEALAPGATGTGLAAVGEALGTGFAATLSLGGGPLTIAIVEQ